MGRGHPYPERPAPIDDPLEGLPFKEQVRRIKQQIREGQQPGAPKLSQYDPPQDGQSFEDWYIKNTPEGQRLAARITRQLYPPEEERQIIGTFMANVRQRMKNGK